MFDFFVIFGVQFICCHPRFGMVSVLNACIRYLFESNSPGMEEVTQKKIKNGGVRSVGRGV